jgi:hypothetical protein
VYADVDTAQRDIPDTAQRDIQATMAALRRCLWSISGLETFKPAVMVLMNMWPWGE